MSATANRSFFSWVSTNHPKSLMRSAWLIPDRPGTSCVNSSRVMAWEVSLLLLASLGERVLADVGDAVQPAPRPLGDGTVPLEVAERDRQVFRHRQVEELVTGINV